MKKTVYLILAVLFVLAASGCSNGTNGGNQQKPGSEPGEYAAEFRGEWIRLDTDQRWYIGGDSITVDGTALSTKVTLEKSSENVITVTAANKEKYTLFAARTANASFTAKVVVLDDDNARSVLSRDAIGSSGQRPPVKIVNPQQPDLSVVVQPDPDTGLITVPNQVPGDLLQLIPDSPEWNGIKVEITPDYGSNQNMGTIPITAGDNFKVSFVPNSSITDYYADVVPRDYTFELENIGTTTCGSSSWELSWNDDDFYYISGATQQEFTGVKPGEKKRLTVRLASKQISAEVKNKEIKANIWNYDSKSMKVREWEDAVAINFYNAPVPFRISSENQVQGVIKSKKGKSYNFKTARTGTAGNYTTTVNVPWSGDDYTIGFLDSTIASGSATAKYSFAVDAEPSTDWASLDPRVFLSTYKPANAKEDTAPTVIDLPNNKKSFMGCLADNSVDYYKVKLSATPPSPQVYTVTFNANDATSGTAPASVTWSPGVTIQLPDQGDIQRTGYVFNGWNTDRSGAGIRYDADSSYTIAGNVTLYAQWGDCIIVPGATFANKVTWLQTNVKSNTPYKIEVTADLSLGPTTLSCGDKTGVTIRLEGDTAIRAISLSSNGSLFTVESGVTLILDNITLKGRSSNSASLVKINSGAALEMREGSRITGNSNSGSHGGGVYLDEGTFILSGGQISGNSVSSRSGGGVYMTGGTFTMTGGKISGNTCSANGGGVWMTGGTFTMSDGEISGNSANSAGAGGGVCLTGGTFTMSGGKISGNNVNTSSSSGGGGVCLDGGGSIFTMIDGEISGNVAHYGGGVMLVANGGATFTMSGGEILGNRATRYGGGVYLANDSIFTFTKTGGTVYGYTNGDAKSNRVSGDDGGTIVNSGHAVYINNSSPVKQRNTTAGPTVNLDSSISGAAGGW